MISLAILPFFSGTKKLTAIPFFPARPVRPVTESRMNSNGG